jgi:Protein of unknown function (DUF2924)
MQERISKQIEELPTLEKAQLVALWTENFGRPPSPNLRKGLMVQTLVYRIQEREFGGLSHSARRRLQEIAASLVRDKSSLKVKDSAPQQGTKLIRIWHGESHEVLAIGTEYEYRGQTYNSLSEIARKITGTRWSGPLFFGVRKA